MAVKFEQFISRDYFINCLNLYEMKKIKHSESEILAILKKQDHGLKVNEICREHGISDATFYNWKSRYGGMELNELKRLKELEYENSRLKKIVANQTLEIDAMKDLIEKKL
jgi:putative transposase